MKTLQSSNSNATIPLIFWIHVPTCESPISQKDALTEHSERHINGAFPYCCPILVSHKHAGLWEGKAEGYVRVTYQCVGYSHYCLYEYRAASLSTLLADALAISRVFCYHEQQCSGHSCTCLRVSQWEISPTHIKTGKAGMAKFLLPLQSCCIL